MKSSTESRPRRSTATSTQSGRVSEAGPNSTRIPNTFPQDQCLDPNLISLRDLSQPEDGAGDGNRTHGSSLGSLGITIIRRPREASILDALPGRKQIAG